MSIASPIGTRIESSANKTGKARIPRVNRSTELARITHEGFGSQGKSGYAVCAIARRWPLPPIHVLRGICTPVLLAATAHPWASRHWYFHVLHIAIAMDQGRSCRSDCSWQSDCTPSLPPIHGLREICTSCTAYFPVGRLQRQNFHEFEQDQPYHSKKSTHLHNSLRNKLISNF